MTDTDDH